MMHRIASSGSALTVWDLREALEGLHPLATIEMSEWGPIVAVETTSHTVTLEAFKIPQSFQDRLDELEDFVSDVASGVFKTKADIITKAEELEQ